MRMAAIGMLFVRHSFRTMFKIRDCTNCWRWQLVCVQFCISCEYSSALRKKFTDFQANLGFRTSVFLSCIGRGCSTYCRRQGKPHTQMEQSKKKKVTIQKVGLAVPIISVEIHQHTVTICLFYEQQWTRSSFVQTFAQTFWRS